MTTIATSTLPRVAADNAEWTSLKAAATALQAHQEQDGSIADPSAHAGAAALVATICEAITALAPLFPHDARYLELLVEDFGRWVNDGGVAVPPILDSFGDCSRVRHNGVNLGRCAPVKWAKPGRERSQRRGTNYSPGFARSHGGFPRPAGRAVDIGHNGGGGRVHDLSRKRVVRRDHDVRRGDRQASHRQR